MIIVLKKAAKIGSVKYPEGTRLEVDRPTYKALLKAGKIKGEPKIVPPKVETRKK